MDLGGERGKASRNTSDKGHIYRGEIIASMTPIPALYT